MGDTRLEEPHDSSKDSHTATPSAAQGAALADNLSPNRGKGDTSQMDQPSIDDADLGTVVKAWSGLSIDQRQAILDIAGRGSSAAAK
jgi:hypothetical protein